MSCMILFTLWTSNWQRDNTEVCKSPKRKIMYLQRMLLIAEIRHQSVVEANKTCKRRNKTLLRRSTLNATSEMLFVSGRKTCQKTKSSINVRHCAWQGMFQRKWSVEDTANKCEMFVPSKECLKERVVELATQVSDAVPGMEYLSERVVDLAEQVLDTLPSKQKMSQRKDCADCRAVCVLVSVPRHGRTSQRSADGRCITAVDVIMQ